MKKLLCLLVLAGCWSQQEYDDSSCYERATPDAGPVAACRSAAEQLVQIQGQEHCGTATLEAEGPVLLGDAGPAGTCCYRVRRREAVIGVCE